MRINLNLILFIIGFIKFSWDMEHTHDIWSWVALGVALVNLAYLTATWGAAIVLTVLEHYFKDTNKQ